jgi:hypothetical protein
MNENYIVFYHFNTKDSMNSSPMKDSDIAFCKETKTVFTNNIEYLSFCWSEIPSFTHPTVSNGRLVMNDRSSLIEGNICVFSDPSYSIDKSTLIIS